MIDEMPISAGIVRAETGELIIEISFSNNSPATCPETLAGKQPVKGEDLCIASEAEVDLLVQKGECKAEGSKLTFGKNLAAFECKAEVELSGGAKERKWDVTLA